MFCLEPLFCSMFCSTLIFVLFYAEQMNNVLREDLHIYEAQQRAIDMDPKALNSDANPRGTIPADEGLLAMRRVIRRRYGDEKKTAQAAD